MFAKNIKNLLAKRVTDRVALKTSVSNIKLVGSRGFKKLKIFHKIFTLSILVVYLFAHQPAFKVPPIQKKLTYAHKQTQSIDKSKLDTIFSLPHPGYISTHYAYWHKGIDIATGYGMPVRPVSKGQVVDVSLFFWGLGHYVVIKHDQNITSTYGHLGRVFVSSGSKVNQNTIIGEVGLSGRTSGPHTHLEITKDGEYINPENILPRLSDYPDERLLKQAEKLSELNLKKELKFTL